MYFEKKSVQFRIKFMIRCEKFCFKIAIIVFLFISDFDWVYDIRETFFYVRRMVDLMKTAKVNASCIYLERLSFYLYMQPKIISKCITLMTSNWQRHTYISDTGNMVEI